MARSNRLRTGRCATDPSVITGTNPSRICRRCGLAREWLRAGKARQLEYPATKEE